jgi:hypothetical protein
MSKIYCLSQLPQEEGEEGKGGEGRNKKKHVGSIFV